MRLAILTDLHANREALEAVLEHAARQRAGRYALLGDFVGYGADPVWVVDRVRALLDDGAIAVQGNHDLAAVEGPAASMRPEPRRVVAWTQAQLDAPRREFLAGLPLSATLGELHFVHANAFDPRGWEYVQGRSEAMRSLRAVRQRIVFCGHMHEPHLYHLSAGGKGGEFVPVPGAPVPLTPPRRWLVIPGAVGQPRDGDPAACYALYDAAGGEVTCWRVPYDAEAAAAKVRAAGLPPELAQRLVDGR